MNADRINELLERYYNAETTETEEKELKRFFTEEEVPAHLLGEKEMFLQLLAVADASTPEGLEERLSQSIDQWEELERKARILPLRWMSGIAASLLVLVTFGWYMYEPRPIRKDTCATPEEAYMHAQQALALFSDALSKGKKQMETAHATTTRVERTIQEQFNKINE